MWTAGYMNIDISNAHCGPRNSFPGSHMAEGRLYNMRRPICLMLVGEKFPIVCELRCVFCMASREIFIWCECRLYDIWVYGIGNDCVFYIFFWWKDFVFFVKHKIWKCIDVCNFGVRKLSAPKPYMPYVHSQYYILINRSTSDHVRLPAEFKHITERRKRN